MPMPPLPHLRSIAAVRAPTAGRSQTYREKRAAPKEEKNSTPLPKMPTATPMPVPDRMPSSA